jgi:hypothetical protein
MMGFVSPESGAPLESRGDRLVSAAGESFPVVAAARATPPGRARVTLPRTSPRPASVPARR